MADDGIPVKDDSEIISIVVNAPANIAPTITTPIGDLIVQEGEVFRMQVVADDANAADTLTFSSQNLPVFASLTDSGNGTALLRVAPNAGDLGTYLGAVVTVTDDGTPALSTSEIFTITVSPPACSDGIDNDGDGLIDWDGAGLGAPDPQCGQPWRDNERPNSSGGCGLGPELAFILPALAALRRSRRRDPRGR